MMPDRPDQRHLPCHGPGVAERRDAIGVWNDLLASCPDPEEIVGLLVGRQKEMGLLLDGAPCCSVARPRFITTAEMRHEHKAVRVLSRAVRKVRDAVMADERLRADRLRGFDEWADGILRLEPPAPGLRTVLRFDSFTTPQGVRFVELNGDIPMGGAMNDGLVAVFRELEIFRTLERRYDVRPNLLQIGMVQTFMHVWQLEGGYGTPRMCVLSFPGGVEDLLSELSARDLRRGGLDAVAAHPEDLELHEGRLHAVGREVDLVYRIMHVYDCLARADEIAPLLRAVKQRAVSLVNPFRSAVLSSKYLFALLTDESYEWGATLDERAAIRAHVPWGRVLNDGSSTDAAGNRIDLAEYVASHKDDLVLKPAHAAGGAGVHLGWRCDAGEWAAILRDALESEYIVQEKVPLTCDEYPLLEAGFPLRTFYEDTDPFHFPGGYSAVIDRISSAEITNVAQGGSLLPTFVVDAR